MPEEALVTLISASNAKHQPQYDSFPEINNNGPSSSDADESLPRLGAQVLFYFAVI